MTLKICKHIGHNVCLVKWIASIYSYNIFPISHLAKLISILIVLSFKHQNSQGGLDALSDANRIGRDMRTAQITLIIYYQTEVYKLNIYETLTCSIPKMCLWLCTRFYIISSHCLFLSSAALSDVREERVDEVVEVLVRHQAYLSQSTTLLPKASLQ
jgi:hypothetical protein